MKRVENLRASLAEAEAYYITSRANIFYYSGFTSEDASLVITPDRQILVTDSRYTVQAKQQSPEFEVVDKPPLDGLKKIGFEENHLTYKEYKKLACAAAEAKLFEAEKEISVFRRKKDAEEIGKIAAAEALGDAAFSHILNIIRPGMTEREAAFEIEAYMLKNGASGTSFETIVASGLRSAMPHGTASDKVMEKGDFVTMDFGCVLDGYCSDMTRTIVLGNASERQKEIYNVVLTAQKEALKEIFAGKKCSDIDKKARDIIKNAGYGDYFGHALGHSVGIEIHENPCFSPKSDDVTEVGNVITVEPGIYIEGFGGVRIEDVVAISTKNTSNLTKSEKDLIII